MPLCTKCNHPHGWYNGLCAACAAAEGVLEEPGEVAGVRPIDEEGVINLEITPVPEAGSATTFTLSDAGLDEGGTVETEPHPEPVEKEEVKSEPPKTRRRRRSGK